MKIINYKHLVFLIFLLSMTFLLAGMKSINQNDTYNKWSGRSDSFKDELPQFPLMSAWMPNGTAIITESNDQFNQEICSDDMGGAIIVWQDNRTGNDNMAVYAQRINSNGDLLWIPDGVAICTITNMWSIVYNVICSDGAGGAIIAWIDNRSGNEDIYAQRVDTDGSIHTGWAANGVAVCTNPSRQWGHKMISDENNGVIIAWVDDRSGNGDIYGQRVLANGDKAWSSPDGQGVPICTQSSYQQNFDICKDERGGMIITWSDPRLGFNNESVYVQRVGDDGGLKWNGTEGVVICNITNNQSPRPTICSDENQGAIIAWSDNRTGRADPNEDIYAQKVDLNGNVLWTEQGIVICSAPKKQFVPKICSDGEGGAIIAWEHVRNYPSYSDEDIYAQKINSAGNTQWTNNGIPICLVEEVQDQMRITIDGAGGAVIVWSDQRNGEDDIYAQHINSVGDIQWNANGMAISNFYNGQSRCRLIYEEGSVIFAWCDQRIGMDKRDIYALKIEIIELNFLCIDLIKQIYSEEYFNLTFYIYNASNFNQGIESLVSNSTFWNGTDVSTKLINLGGGNYSISLESIPVAPEENPICLEGNIFADGFVLKSFKFLIAVDPEVIDKEPGPSPPSNGGGGDGGEEEEPQIPGYDLYITFLIIFTISIVILFKNNKRFLK